MEAAIVLIRSINNKAPPFELVNHCRRRIGDVFGFRIFHTILRSDRCHIPSSLATGTTQAVLADCPNTEMPLLVRLAYIPVLPRKSVGGRSRRSKRRWCHCCPGLLILALLRIDRSANGITSFRCWLSRRVPQNCSPTGAVPVSWYVQLSSCKEGSQMSLY